MLKSMTGFSRAQADNDAYRAVVEIRTVNHRYLDVRMRGGSGLGSLEKRVRDLVGSELARGKVDVSVNLRPRSESAFEIEVDRPLMRDFVRLAQELGSESGIDSELELRDLIGFSPAFQVKERDLGKSSSAWGALEPALKKALQALRTMRAAEGSEMAADLDRRTATLVTHVDRIESLSEAHREARRGELEAKVKELVGGALEPTAIAMEVARLVERGDIAEEITRFRSHVELFKKTVASDDACGKKLDFIVQEMNREVNTMGSKSQDVEIAEQVIAMKAELERVREQVQNVE